MVVILDKQNRGKLNEGRNYQMGFGFLKNIGVRLFETIQRISPCKDYLNDVVYSEATGLPVKAYGLSTEKTGLFDNEKYAYLGIKILPRQDGSSYNQMEEHIQNLNENYKNLKKFLNYFDSALGLKKTQIYQANDNHFVIKFDVAWARYTYSISLFSLLCRVGQFYKGEQTPIEYLQTFKDFNPDVYLVKNNVPKILNILEMKSLPVHDLATLGQGTDVHNFGINAFQI